MYRLVPVAVRRGTPPVAVLVLLSSLVLAQQSAPPAQTPASKAPQRPPVTFQLEVEYVEVNAVVTDAQGNFIRGLTREDFTIFEDGDLQEVAEFALVDIPIERAERPLYSEVEIEPDVRSNERRFDGRVYVLVLDDLHTAALQSPRVRIAARRFIQRNFGSNDIASIIYTSGRTDATQEFTSNRRLLLESADKFVGRKIRSQTLERLDEEYRLRDDGDQRDNARGRPRSTVDDPLEMERGFHARNALETLRNVATWMTGIRGRRKALLFISEGIDYNIYEYSNYQSTINRSTREAVAAATRANVNIYSVDPRGLSGLGDVGIEIGSLAETNELANPANRLGPTSMLDTLRLAQDSLRVLSDETGGFAAVNSNDIAGAFDRIVRDNSSYYTLAYYPKNTERDGKFRRIEVRVSRPDVTVRARKGYLAPRGNDEPRPDFDGPGPPELRVAMANPLPVSGLTLATSAVAFKGGSGKGSVVVAVEIEGQDLTFSEQGGRFVDQLEVHVIALDREGQVQDGDQQTVDLRLRPDTRQAVARNGFRVISRLELEPGRYQLRAAAWESGAQAVGTVHYELEVPDFSKQKFGMSGLVLTSSKAARTPTARLDEDLKQVLPGPPTTKREFTADDEVVLFVDVYDNVTRPPHRVDITTTVRADDGRVVFTAYEERSSEELAGVRGSYGHIAKIPLGAMAPGLYVLRVEARSRLQAESVASREVLVRIRRAAVAGAAGR